MNHVEKTPALDKNPSKDMEERIKENIRQVYDPEIPVNIYELGLIYNIEVAPDLAHAKVEMTLTSPNCPAAEQLPMEVQQQAEEVIGLGKVTVDVVWDPPWDQDRMSEEAQMALGLI